MLLSWGLFGPGKGIEWAIDAMADLKDLSPRPRYVVAGRTHPKVVSSQGEVYRDMLVARTWAQGVAASVTFDSAYRDVRSLTHLIQDATVVVLPYDSRDQVTSGVLVDALAAGRPVVATAFPHAVELLASGAGLVVPHGDPDALSTALRRVLTEPGLASRWSARRPVSARPSVGPPWPANTPASPIRSSTIRSHSGPDPLPGSARLTSSPPSFAHLERMTDDCATFEHADHASPRREHGYCTDDMARVLVVTSREPEPSQSV